MGVLQGMKEQGKRKIQWRTGLPRRRKSIATCWKRLTLALKMKCRLCSAHTRARGGLGGMHHCPMWRSRNEDDADLPLHWLAELLQDATCLKVRKVPAQYYSTRLQHRTAPHSTAQHLTAPHTEPCWLFTAWVQLLVFKDTVALFQYQLKLWGDFLKNCH